MPIFANMYGSDSIWDDHMTRPPRGSGPVNHASGSFIAAAVAPEAGAMRVLRATVAVLPRAVDEADLTEVGEFHALFQLMLGLGLDPSALGEKLEVGAATIGRYATGASAPGTVHARRGALIETARAVEHSLLSGKLQCLRHLPSA